MLKKSDSTEVAITGNKIEKFSETPIQTEDTVPLQEAVMRLVKTDKKDKKK